jgi:tetratricopeptide (TPR) repeat protein
LAGFALRWLLIPVAGAAALWIAWIEHQTLRGLEWSRLESSLSELRTRQPWGGLSGRALAAAPDATLGVEPEAAEAVLAWQLRRYPLDPLRWFNRALNAHLAGECPARVQDHLKAALAVQPGHRGLNWQVALLAYELGDFDRAEDALQTWLQDNPAGTGEALALAFLWLPDARELIDRILPPGEAHLVAALNVARRFAWVDMAIEAWLRLPQPRTADDPALLDFVDLALAEGEPDLAMYAWWQTFPDYRAGGVPNPDFQHELGSGRGLHWRTRVPAGAQVARDLAQFVTAPASLRVDFDGRENLRMSGLSLRIPIPAGPRAWVLSGHWRAEGLTTVSLPYLWVSGEKDIRLDLPAADFDWAPFELEIETSGAAAVLDLQVRRDPTRLDFDRFLAGRLWVDALRLEPAAVAATAD